MRPARIARTIAAAGVLAAAVAAGQIGSAALRQQSPPQPAAQQTPVFRGATDVVTIDVSIRSNGTPVAGLTAADFVLADNGVPQIIEVVGMEAVPVDITVLVETSEDHEDDIEGLTRHIGEMAALARPTDRLRVMSIGTYVTDLIPAREAASFRAPATPLATRGISSAYDALAAALMREVGTDRRHLVIAMTNGVDATSAVEAETIREIARRSEATLHISQIDVAIDPLGPQHPPVYLVGRQRWLRDRCAASGVCQTSRLFWRPYDAHEFDVLGEAATLTGGQIYMPGLFTNRTASAIFERVFADYRRSYLVRYTPAGVAREGWHDVTVTVPKHPSYEIVARRGYAVEGGAGGPPTPIGRAGRDAGAGAGASPAPAAAAAAGGPASPAPSFGGYDTVVDLYGRGEYAAAAQALRRSNPTDLLAGLRADGTPWPSRPQRTSAFALEVAEAALNVGTTRQLREAALNLLESERRMIRHPVDPDDFERFWLWAEIALRQNLTSPTLAEPAIDYALGRFPGEPQFLLARAVVADQALFRSMLTAPDAERLSSAILRRVDDVRELYQAAMAHPRVAGEARLREAWLLHRAARHAEALALLEPSVPMPGAPVDPVVSYLGHLFRGRVLDTLDRPTEAAAAFREALAVAPAAQSARIGLMTVLLRLGDPRGAELQAEAVQVPTSSIDPFWLYWLGDYRHYPAMIRQLREHVR